MLYAYLNIFLIILINNPACVMACGVIALSCGGRTRTCDLQVMSLASYQLLHSAILCFALQR